MREHGAFDNIVLRISCVFGSLLYFSMEQSWISDEHGARGLAARKYCMRTGTCERTQQR